MHNKYWIATLFSTIMKAVHKSKAQEWSEQTAFAAWDARSRINLYNIYHTMFDIYNDICLI